MTDVSNAVRAETTDLRAKDFTYVLPTERIAQHPAHKRDQSRLLIANSRLNEISHGSFNELPAALPEGALLVVNSSKVLSARLEARKPAGGAIEIFLLEPDGDASVQDELSKLGSSRWRCLLGGRNLNKNMMLNWNAPNCSFTAEILEKESSEALIRFNWRPIELTFGELIDRAGKTPLPPYIKRGVDESDIERYQTVYANIPGSVAAPTAGLHFTPELFAKAETRGILRAEISLAVGLGTFKPISVEKVGGIEMHAEKISANLDELRRIAASFDNNLPVVCVGTTSLRALESIYWFGVEALENNANFTNGKFILEQWAPYKKRAPRASAGEAINAAIRRAEASNACELRGTTSLIIAPGYRFGTAAGLITNFHQPGSTLLLLVAAFLGGNFWRDVYNEALAADYRFLSYGDACLFWR